MDDKSNGSVANTNKRLDEAKFLAKQIDLMRVSKNKTKLHNHVKVRGKNA